MIVFVFLIFFAVYWLAGADTCFILSAVFFAVPLFLLNRLEGHKED